MANGEPLGKYQGFALISADFSRTVGLRPDNGYVLAFLPKISQGINIRRGINVQFLNPNAGGPDFQIFEQTGAGRNTAGNRNVSSVEINITGTEDSSRGVTVGRSASFRGANAETVAAPEGGGGGGGGQQKASIDVVGPLILGIQSVGGFGAPGGKRALKKDIITIPRVYVHPEGIEVVEIDDVGDAAIVRIGIRDERWMWQERGTVSGAFNKTTEKGGVAVKINPSKKARPTISGGQTFSPGTSTQGSKRGFDWANIDPKTLKDPERQTPWSLYDLLKYCILNLPLAYGFDRNSMPNGMKNDEITPLNVDFGAHTLPVEAMEKLLDEYGLTLALEYSPDKEGKINPTINIYRVAENPRTDGSPGVVADRLVGQRSREILHKKLEHVRYLYRPPRIRVIGGKRQQEVVCSKWVPVIEWPFAMPDGGPFLNVCRGEYLPLKHFLNKCGILGQETEIRKQAFYTTQEDGEAYKTIEFKGGGTIPGVPPQEMNRMVRKALATCAWKKFQAPPAWRHYTPALPLKTMHDLFRRKKKPGSPVQGTCGLTDYYEVFGTIVDPPVDGQFISDFETVALKARVPGQIWVNGIVRDLSGYGFNIDPENLVISFNTLIGSAELDAPALKSKYAAIRKRREEQARAKAERDLAKLLYKNLEDRFDKLSAEMWDQRDKDATALNDLMDARIRFKDDLKGGTSGLAVPFFGGRIIALGPGAKNEINTIYDRFEKKLGEIEARITRRNDLLAETEKLYKQAKSKYDRLSKVYTGSTKVEMIDVSECSIQDPNITVRWAWELNNNHPDDYYVYDSITDANLLDGLDRDEAPLVIEKKDMVWYQGIGGVDNREILDEEAQKIIDNAFNKGVDSVTGLNYELFGAHLIRTSSRTVQVVWSASSNGTMMTYVSQDSLVTDGIGQHIGPVDKMTHAGS
jgi:hypothetical protein